MPVKRIPRSGPGNSSSPRIPQWVIYTGLVLTTVSVFSTVRHFSFVDYDDLDYVVDNLNVTTGLSTSNVLWAFAHAYEHTGGPLTWLSYMVDASLGGVEGGRFHLTNLVIHVAAVCLLFAALNSLTRARYPSAFVAGLFAVHPLHVESVAWVAERKDVLSGFFLCLTLVAYTSYARRGGWWRYGLVAVCFVAGLLSKPIVITAPLLLLLLDYWPLNRLSYRAVIEKVPLLAASALVAVMTMAAQRELGAVSSIDAVPPALRLQVALVTHGWYLVKTLWPSGLAAIYPLPSTVPVFTLAFSAAALALLTGAAWKWRHRYPFVLTGWLWFLITLVPVAGLFQTGAHIHADRNMYIALIGLGIMLAWGLAEVAERRRPIAAAAACAYLLAMAVAARQQVEYWRDSEALFRRAASTTANNYIAETGLATTLRRRGKIEEPISLYRQALQTAPRHAAARGGLGEALLASGQPEAAVFELERAVELEPASPEFNVNLGSALHQSGRGDEAVVAFRRAVQLAPERADTHYGLGAALTSAGDFDAALPEFQAAIRLDPRSVDAHYNFGLLLIRLGRTADAVAVLERAARLSPGNAQIRNNLAGALLSLGQFDRAIAELEEAVRLTPGSPELNQNLQLAREARQKTGRAGGS